MAKSFLNASQSRGLRNNNPGNMRRTNNAWQGKIPFPLSKDAEFEQFYELAWGIRAVYKQIHTDFSRGYNTVAKFITKYAPPVENNTAAYINHVAQQLGISPITPIILNEATTIAIAKAVILMEIGENYSKLIEQSDYNDAWLYMNYSYGSPDLPVLEISTAKKTCKMCGAVLVGFALFFFTCFTIII